MAIGPTCITLDAMGKGDNTRPRKTRELDAVKLAALTKESKSTIPPPTTHEQPVIAVGRAKTLDDPFTTGLLAEVARRSQTQEFDEDMIEEVLSSLDYEANRHPHTRRRSS